MLDLNCRMANSYNTQEGKLELSLPQRARGVKVLKAVSSPLRLQILNFLFDKGSLSYTELMSALKLNPTRDAGRFAYHLKFLLKANLVDADGASKKYLLTDLGKMVIDVADRVEKKAVKPKKMLVRTSDFTLEAFDAHKIANALIKEAKIPADLAQKTAKEAEKLLVKSKTKYITAPLIREIVNTLLIEKGFEEYRHKLTRLGLPVHEVTSLVEAKRQAEASESLLSTAGESVFKEYTLLNVFPRDIADAHVSGALHINNLSTWILKPNEVMHDLRFFLRNGLSLEKANPLPVSQGPPANFSAALTLILNVLWFSSQEINENQNIEYFNVFLSPFAKDVERSELKAQLRLFLLNVSQHIDVTIGLEVKVPDNLAGKPAMGQHGKQTGKYGDFSKESQLLSELILEIYSEESSPKPISNPKLMLNVCGELFDNEKAMEILLKAHELSDDRAPIYFANMIKPKGKKHAFSTSGIKLETSLSEEWETDTLRTGCLGYVSINLPRIARESDKEITKFLAILKDRFELATRALIIKQRSLKHHGKTTLPFLLQTVNKDTYFRLENSFSVINLAGLKEAVESFCEKSWEKPECKEFITEVVKSLKTYSKRMSRRQKRLSTALIPSQETSTRLAQLDIEKYGVARVKFSGTRETPFYSTTTRLPIKHESLLLVPSELLEVQNEIKPLVKGGSLAILESDDETITPKELLNLTKHLMEKENVDLITYHHKITYCANCQKSWLSEFNKCPSCGAIGSISKYDRFRST